MRKLSWFAPRRDSLETFDELLRQIIAATEDTVATAHANTLRPNAMLRNRFDGSRRTTVR
jgi:hypothetical protein